MNTKNNSIINDIIHTNQKRKNTKYSKRELPGITLVVGLSLIFLFGIANSVYSMDGKTVPVIKKLTHDDLVVSDSEMLITFFDTLSTGRGNLLVYNTLTKHKVVLGSFSQAKKILDLAKAISSSAPTIALRPLDSILLVGHLVPPDLSHGVVSWPEEIEELIQRLGDAGFAKTRKKEIAYAIKSAKVYANIVIHALPPDADDSAPVFPEQVSIMNKNAHDLMLHIWSFLVAKGETISDDEIKIARHLLMIGDLDQFQKGSGEYIPQICKSMSIKQEDVRLAIGWWAKAMHTEVQMVALSKVTDMLPQLNPIPNGIGVLSLFNPCQGSCRRMIDSTNPQELLPFLYYKDDEESKKTASSSSDRSSTHSAGKPK